MRSGTPFFLYLVALCTLGLVVHVWWRSGNNAAAGVAEELRPIRQELREVRSEIEEINRVSLKQQATLYKIEAVLDMQSGATPAGSAAALLDSMAPATVSRMAEPGAAPPPPPPIDDRALSAFVQTQAAARQAAAELSTPATAAAAPPPAAPPAPPAAVPAEQRQTVVFTPTSTGRIARTARSAPAVVRPQPVLPPVQDGLSLDDLAALVSTVSVQAASTAPAAPAVRAAPAVSAPSATEPRGSDAAPAPVMRTAVEAADPALPGAAPASADMTRIASEEPSPAASTPPVAAAPIQPQNAPRRVTTVPSLTAEPQPSVPPVRASRLARDERTRAADITSALSISDRLAPQSGQREKVTISDVLDAQENE